MKRRSALAPQLRAHGTAIMGGWGRGSRAVLRGIALLSGRAFPAPAGAPAGAMAAGARWTSPGMFGGGAHCRRGFAATAPAADDDHGSEENNVRNFAIIAHVDHGKTTLLDTLMRQANQDVSTERLMDNRDLERERGITISSKYTSFDYKGTTFNAVDTPGHADFGGEVERVLDMVDGCLLLVDCIEGPMAQTKFVLGKALRKGLRPIVVLNKVDRPAVTERGCAEVESKLFDLFAAMGACDEQLDFAVVYASARAGVCSDDLATAREMCRRRESTGAGDMSALLDALRERTPPPPGSRADPFRLLVSMIEHDPFVGRLVTGRVASGEVKVGDRVKALTAAAAGGAARETGRVTKLFTSRGGVRHPLDRAAAGDVVSVAGLSGATVTDTVCDAAVSDPLPATPVDPPTLRMTFGVNDSSLGGREGKSLTGRQIWDRLVAEAETNVALRVLQRADGGGDRFEVQGRGELHLGVLIETMRREKFELSISPPAVLFRQCETTGRRLEPVEELTCEVEETHSGGVIEAVVQRKGEMTDMAIGAGEGGRTRMTFTCPSRGLIGFRQVFINETRGTGTLTRAFHGYEPYRGAMDRVRKGAIVSVATGVTTAYALGQLEARGTLFVGPKTEVYEGMIIGEHSREETIEVNPCKEKKLTNMRASGADEQVRLTPPRLMSLEEAIGYVQADELIEVTPTAIRLRKAELNSSMRKSNARKAAKSAD